MRAEEVIWYILTSAITFYVYVCGRFLLFLKIQYADVVREIACGDRDDFSLNNSVFPIFQN